MDKVKSPSIRSCCAALGGLPRGLVRPTSVDHDFLAGLVDAGLPPARAEVSVRALPQVGSLHRSSPRVSGSRGRSGMP